MEERHDALPQLLQAEQVEIDPAEAIGDVDPAELVLDPAREVVGVVLPAQARLVEMPVERAQGNLPDRIAELAEGERLALARQREEDPGGEVEAETRPRPRDRG